MRRPTYFVYIITNKTNTALYTGVTNNIVRRVWEHKSKLNPGFTARYNCSKLVYFEIHSRILQAINREKLLKKWRRSWKIDLIEESNPNWEDLSDGWYAPPKAFRKSRT